MFYIVCVNLDTVTNKTPPYANFRTKTDIIYQLLKKNWGTVNRFNKEKKSRRYQI